MERDSFGFFRSFYEQLVKIHERDPNSADALLWAIVRYGMTREEPKFTEDQFIADVAWVNIKIVLDSGWKNYENGTKPKRKKRNGSETEANEKRMKSESLTNKNKNKKENKNKEENENIKEREKENSSPLTPQQDNIKSEFENLNLSSTGDNYGTLTNQVWSEQVMMTLHMTTEQYKQKVTEFVADQRIKDTHHIDDNDIRNHFYSWLKKQPNNNGNNNQPIQTESPRERSIRETEEYLRKRWAQRGVYAEVSDSTDSDEIF